MKRRDLIFLAVPIIFSVILYIVPFALHGQHPLGYDTGFYRKFLIQKSLFEIVPGLGSDALVPRVILGVIRATGMPTDYILYGSYIAAQVSVIVALFLLVRFYVSVEVATITALLFVFSSIQLTAYWFVLLKNSFGLLFILLSFLLIERESPLAIIPSVLLVFTHQTSTIIYIGTLVVFLLINGKRWKHILPLIASTATIFLYLHYPEIRTVQRQHWPTAVFIDRREYSTLSLPLLIPIVAGVRSAAKYRRSIFAAFGIVTLSFPMLSLPFYQRIFVFTDIVLIVIAALGIYALYRIALQSNKKIVFVGTCVAISIFGGWYVGNVFNTIRNLRPLVSPPLIKAFESITNQVPNGATILTESEIAPWVNGYTQNKVIAPGLLGDSHNYEEWLKFWVATATPSKLQFLNDFDKPLYLFIEPSATDGFVPKAPCVIQHTPFIYEYRC